MAQKRPHCPHCGRGSNFHLPKIAIDWEQINREQFEGHKASLRERVSSFLSHEEAYTTTMNWMSRGDMLLIEAMLNAAKVDEQ
jgi:hypothetical protein